jgi:hypothetical protein
MALDAWMGLGGQLDRPVGLTNPVILCLRCGMMKSPEGEKGIERGSGYAVAVG